MIGIDVKAENNSGILNVYDYGVVGDGVTDDTYALKSALTSSYELGLPLMFPDGTFLISSDLYIKRELISSGAVIFTAGEIGDKAPMIAINIARKMHVQNFTFENIVLKVEPEENNANIYLPTKVERNHFLNSRLTVGQADVITSGYEICKNLFSSGKSRGFDAITIVNANHVVIIDNDILEYNKGIVVNPSISFSANTITIAKNRNSNSATTAIYLNGSSMNRVSNITISDNTVNASLRDTSSIKIAGVMALYCVNLTIKNNTISHQSDCIRFEAVLGAYVDNNHLITTTDCVGLRSSGSLNITVTRNYFNATKEGYQLIIGDASVNPQTINNMYYSKNWSVIDNKFNCINHSIKCINTEFVNIERNDFYAVETLSSQGFIWFASGVTSANYYNNKFYAPDGKPVKNDSGATTDISEQNLIKITVSKPQVREPVVLDSDSSLNNASSYVIRFSLGDVRQLKQLADDDNKKTLSEWMATVDNPVLAWNASAWNLSTGNIADIVVNGGLFDDYGLEDYWTMRSMIFIDLHNRLTCRNFATSDWAKSVPLMIGSMSIAEGAWQTATFRSPLVCDGNIYDPVPSGLISEDGYSKELSGRCCLGQVVDGGYILLIVDGISGASGCTMKQAAKKMFDLGCINAFNLDGGGSTTLWYNGEVINKPSDETGERKIPSVMYI